jgi:putative endonuclease
MKGAMPPRTRTELGKWAEDQACRALARRGYAILERRYRSRRGEIDIIARDRGVLVFIEVKSRRTLTCGSPASGVTAQKQQRLLRLAAQYLQRHGLTNAPCRFDVVSVYCPSASEPPRIDHLQSAFDENVRTTC